MTSKNVLENLPIDFVILWVDGNDPKWQKEKNKYIPGQQTDTRPQRYRDWDNLQYWFRGVEKFAPWVHKIFFITWGHLPPWLNTDHPKLVIVKHTDYMPDCYLPTFNSQPLELNLHKIKGLSEQFVYFNDDMFLINETKETDFFKNGLPCDSAVLSVHCPEINAGFNYYPQQAIQITNKYFNMHQVIRKNPGKWFNLKYGKDLLRTLYLLPCPRFPGILQYHLPSSFLKSTFDIIWEMEPDLLQETCNNRFRTKLDYNQWVMRNWQLASGNFVPRKANIGKTFFIEKDRDSIQDCVAYIKKQRGKIVVLNDGEMTQKDFLKNKNIVINAFNHILPKKSLFEK